MSLDSNKHDLVCEQKQFEVLRKNRANLSNKSNLARFFLAGVAYIISQESHNFELPLVDYKWECTVCISFERFKTN